MHKSYSELEQRYKKYYIKLFIKYFIVLAVISAIASSYLFYGSENEAESVQNNEKKVKIYPQKDIAKEENLSETVVNTDETKKQPVTQKTKEQNKTSPETKRVVLKPQYGFDLKTLLKQTPPPIKQDKTPQPTQAKPLQAPQKENAAAKKDLSTVLKIEHNNADTLQEKIAIFHQRPHVAKAYKVAKGYFEQKDYDKAIVWLKKADSLKPAQENVFELYARTLYKQNKKEEALNLLNYFLNIKKSQKLEKLKERIDKEKLVR